MFNYNGTGVEMGAGYQTAPEGEYTLSIKNTVEKTTKIKEDGSGGYPMVSAMCEIDDPGDSFGIVVFHNVTFMPPDKKGASMALHFLKAIGEPFEGQINVEPQNWKAKKFRAKIKLSKDLQGRPRNEIAYVIIPESESSDEIPF